MSTSKHLITVLLLFVGIAVGVAISMLAGFWLDDHRAIGTSGIIPFLIVAAAVLLSVELLAGYTGEWIERHRPHRT